jgi:uncharacterized membrane protein YcaP (DUF421 family)
VSITELLLRIAISFVSLLILARIMGRKEISQMTFFNFVSAIAFGTIGASLAIDPSLSIRNGLIALAGWTGITILFAILDIKSKKAHTAIVGRPIILIKEGKIIKEALRKVRLDIESLNGLLRKKNVFSIADVDYAYFETDGTLSVMRKESKQPVTKSDLNIQQANAIFSTTIPVISDGQVDLETLDKFNLNEKWLQKQLSAAGINSMDEVLYAKVQKDGTLHIDHNNVFH